MNVINSAVIVESGNELRKKSLPQYFLDNSATSNGNGDFEKKTLREIEKEHIEKVLKHTGGNRTKSAKFLGISRVSLISKIKNYGLDK